MAKAPRQGAVKTRLVPPLSTVDAAELSACFIRDIAGNILAAARAAPIDGYVAYSPPGSADLFAALLPDRVGLLPPRRIGLAESLLDAAQDLLAAGYGAACLVNADSPTLPTDLMVAAAQALALPGDRLVLGPAEDGGYYLIGMKHPHPRLFEEIDWSTERVFGQTLDRAREIGLETVTLASWYDVDDAASLRRLAAEVGGSPAGYAAPYTAALLRRLASRL